MKKEILEQVEIPEGIEVSLDGGIVSVKGPQGEIKRKFNMEKLQFHREHNQISLGCKKATKNEKKRINALISHLKNMVDGVSKKFEYQLKICYSHFPITAEIKGKEIIVKNFLGERANRRINLLDGAEVEVDKEMITVRSANKETAGQMSANIEKVTKVNKRDRRVFQDGIFIINKAGKEI